MRALSNPFQKIGQRFLCGPLRRPFELRTGTRAVEQRDTECQIEPSPVDVLQPGSPCQIHQSAEHAGRNVDCPRTEHGGDVVTPHRGLTGQVERPRHAAFDGEHDGGRDVVGVDEGMQRFLSSGRTGSHGISCIGTYPGNP